MLCSIGARIITGTAGKGRSSPILGLHHCSVPGGWMHGTPSTTCAHSTKHHNRTADICHLTAPSARTSMRWPQMLACGALQARHCLSRAPVHNESYGGVRPRRATPLRPAPGTGLWPAPQCPPWVTPSSQQCRGTPARHCSSHVSQILGNAVCLLTAADQGQRLDLVSLIVAHHKAEGARLVCDSQRVIFICGSKDTSVHSQRAHSQ